MVARADRRGPAPGNGRVVVLVPAHDEEGGIALTIESLLGQAYRHIEIVVISDNSTDGTERIVEGYLPWGVTLLRTRGNADKKSGAMNMAIDLLANWAVVPEFVMTMDADSWVEDCFVERAVAVLRNRPELGAVTGAVFGKPGSGTTAYQRFLCWLQEVEYARHLGARLSSYVFTLSGAGSLYRTEALLAIKAVHDGIVFELGSRVEDVTSTMHLRQLGWRVTSNEFCRVWTDVMPTHRSLMAQRIGWTLGSLGEVAKMGVRRWSLTTIARLSTIPLVQLLWLTQVVWAVLAWRHGNLFDHALPRLAIFSMVGAFNGFAVRQLGWKSGLVCSTNIPMLLFWPFVVEWVARSYYQFLRGKRATW